MKDIRLVRGPPVKVVVQGKDGILYTGIIRLHPTRPWRPDPALLEQYLAMQEGRRLEARSHREEA